MKFTYFSRELSISSLINIYLLLLLFIPGVFTCQKNNRKPTVREENRKYEGKIFIAVPKKLSLDTNEVLAVIAYDVPHNEILEISISDFPGSTKVFSSTRVMLQNGIPAFASFNLPSNELLKFIDHRFSNPKLHVLVEAKIGEKFNKKMKLLVDYNKGYVFLQTDKPIYNPQQTVHIRIIPLNKMLQPENYNIRVQIKNPQDIIVQETMFSDPWKQTIGQFPKMNFTFPPFSMLGKWTIMASHGTNFQQTTSVAFHVEEYVLPTFSVSLQVTNAILSEDEDVTITVKTEYFYGKKLNGNVICKLNIVDDKGNTIQAGTKIDKVRDGEAEISLSVSKILERAKIEMFPFESELSINVSVTDGATGMTENAPEKRIIFTKSPYRISFKHSLKYYKPRVVSAIVVDITYVNGKPAENIPAKIKIIDANNREVRVSESKHKSDSKGRIIFYVTPPANTLSLTVTVTTDDKKYESEQQASKAYNIQKFSSENFIAISRSESTRKVKIGENFVATVFTHPSNKFDNLFYMVMARGRILLLKHLPTGGSHQKQLEFLITTEMSPVLRIIIFSLIDNKELVVDSIRIEVEQKCKSESEVSINPEFPTIEPGSTGKLILKGEPKTIVGLLAVDKAIYALKNQDKLTKEKLFKRIAGYDYGTGLGDGANSQKILSNSGLFIFGNFEMENTKDKIGIISNKLKIVKFDDLDWKDVINPYTDDIHFDHDDIDENMEEETPVRSDFRETWLFEDFEIGTNGLTVVNTKLPDSITTWVIQAVSVSPQWGMCVSNPEEIKSFKNIFLQLNIPYSIVRNEQLNLQATVFNYHTQKIPVTIYMYGVKNLCSGVKEGEKSERKKITIEPHSSGTVHFPIVPLVAQDYFIRVVALSPFGGDVVVKKLHVVAEGIIEEVDFVTILDPTNQQKRKKRYIITDILSDSIDASKQLQEIKLNLQPKIKFIPGTERCIISAIGTEYGPTAQTVILDPRHLIRMPTGCCEQTMMYLGPTLYTLNFLKSMDKITSETEEKLFDFVSEGYKRALTFRKKDGSFSIWPRRLSSVWLTSFVTKIFCQVSKFIYVDENVICKGISWLISKQNSDGSFEDNYPVIRKDIMTGSNGKIPMTAFLLTVLRECTCDSVDTQKAQAQAKSFLEVQYLSISDSYIMALTAYALSAINSQKKHEANAKLLQMSKYDEGLNRRYWDKFSKTESLEVTAYGLLTQLHLENISTSLSIVNWLNTQRLNGGTFPSSQASVIALQALSEYSIKSKFKDTSLTCKASTSYDENLVKTIEINNDNALVLQQMQIDKLCGMLYFNVSGKGVGLLSVKMRYNVPKGEKQTCKFETTVNVSEVRKQFSIDSNCETESKIGMASNENTEVCEAEYFNSNSNSKLVLEVKICSRYLSSKNSDMTIIDAGVFSGFNPIREDLDKIINDYNNTVDRYELEERNIIFYLDHVTHETPVCVNFRVKRDYIVGNVQSSVVKVYDYYNNDQQCIKFYSPGSNSPLLSNICKGSQCLCDENVM